MSVIILNKEKNVTSFKAIKDVQKEMKFKKAGHGGTLDPLATGVLPIFFNSSTRFIEYIANDSKEYVAEFVLGLSSNTEDITGQLEYHPNSKEPSKSDIDKVLQSFIGKIKQLAPEYSAKKIKGVPMYKLARKGEKFERREQEIEITSLDLIEYDYPNFSIQVNCSKGTYVRTLGCDIAKMLGTTAVLSDLKRTRFGNLSIDDSISFDALKNLDNQAKMQYVKRVEEILINIPRINISSTEVNKFRNGSKVEPENNTKTGQFMVFAQEEFLGIGKVEEDMKVQPVKVLS